MKAKRSLQINTIAIVICISIALLLSELLVQIVHAANPRVMVSDYSITEGEVCAGEAFTLNITLKNTASSAVKNVKLTISTEQGELLPVEGAGTAYIEKINGNEEVEITFKMTAVEGLQEKSYKLSLKTEYEGSNGLEYTVDESIFIPVGLEQRVSVTDIFIPESYIELGDTVEVSASVNNLGDGTLYNVTAQVKGDNLSEAESYIGNIESGKSGTIDVLAKATAVSKQFGDKNEIVITYEDRKGNVSEETFALQFTVAQPVYENLEKVKESTDNSGIVKTILLIAAGVIVVAVLVYLVIQRQKRKKKILEEF